MYTFGTYSVYFQLVFAFRRRESIGQTVATSVNYIKNLVTVFEMAISNYSVEDMNFPKTFDLTPCPNKIGKMKLLLSKIKLLYKSKLKKQPQELFDRKTIEAQALPDYTDVRKIIQKVETDVPEFLTQLETSVVADGEINVAPVKGSPIQKMVSHKPITHGQQASLAPARPRSVFIFLFSLQVSSWWRKSTCSLAVVVLWFSKHRSGVITNMLMSEWLARKQQDDKTVVTVAKNKTRRSSSSAPTWRLRWRG